MRWRRLSPIESLWRSPRTKVGFPKVTWRPNWNGPRPSTAFVFEIWMLQRYIVRLHEIPELYIVLVDQHLASLGTAFSARRRFVKRRVKLFTGRDIDSKYLQSFHFDHFQINLVVFEINLPERTSTTEWSSIGWHSANAAATKNRKNLWKSTDPSIRPILTRNKFSPVCGQLSLSRPTRRWRLPKAPSPMSRRWRPALVSRLRLQEKFEIAWRLDMLGWTSVLAAWYNLIGHNSISVLATCTAEPAELQAFLGFCAGKIDEASGLDRDLKSRYSAESNAQPKSQTLVFLVPQIFDFAAAWPPLKVLESAGHEGEGTRCRVWQVERTLCHWSDIKLRPKVHNSIFVHSAVQISNVGVLVQILQLDLRWWILAEQKMKAATFVFGAYDFWWPYRFRPSPSVCFWGPVEPLPWKWRSGTDLIFFQVSKVLVNRPSLPKWVFPRKGKQFLELKSADKAKPETAKPAKKRSPKAKSKANSGK